MKQTLLPRIFAAVLGLALAIYAALSLASEFMPWGSGGPAKSKAAGADYSAIAATLAMNGHALAAHAMAKAHQTIGTPANFSDFMSYNADARDAAVAAVRMSPIHPDIWLALAALNAQIKQPPEGPLKMSYFTGTVSADMRSTRTHVAVTTGSIRDEEIRIFAQSDIRLILTQFAALRPALIASYRQAPNDGRQFLLDTARDIDPAFGASLQQTRSP